MFIVFVRCRCAADVVGCGCDDCVAVSLVVCDAGRVVRLMCCVCELCAVW